jgi:hypothetical protein
MMATQRISLATVLFFAVVLCLALCPCIAQEQDDAISRQVTVFVDVEPSITDASSRQQIVLTDTKLAITDAVSRQQIVLTDTKLAITDAVSRQQTVLVQVLAAFTDAASREHSAGPAPPAVPDYVSPGNGAVRVGRDVALDWLDSARTDVYDVYLWRAGEQPPTAPTAPGVGDTTYTLPNRLDEARWHNWFLVARSEYGETSGPVWGFRTVMESLKFDPVMGDAFDTGAIAAPGSQVGWSSFGFTTTTLGWPDYESSGGAYRAHVAARDGYYRASGVSANPAEWLPYAYVGPDNIVRAKYFVYAGGQANPAMLNQVPNIRARLQTRFAQNSMLEVFNHFNYDPEATALSQDFRPSKDPLKPSLYRVDLDPVDAPYLEANATVEGVQRAFEAFSTDPQDNGFVAMTESVIGVYPSAATPDSVAPVKVYATSESDAGDLKAASPAERVTYNYIPIMEQGRFGTAETTGPIPTYVEDSLGITIDSTTVPTEKIGIASFNINPDRGTNDYAGRVRVESGKQYKLRFHLTATQQTNRQPQIRLRGRSVKFNWTHKFEIGGAWAGGTTNNTIAQQILPGIGCQNPDRYTTETAGGWYTLIMHTPLEEDIRAEFAPNTPLSARMPNLSAQAGPGVGAPSRRDLLCGFDVIDTLTFNGLQHREQGQVTLDRIEVRAYDRVPD